MMTNSSVKVRAAVLSCAIVLSVSTSCSILGDAECPDQEELVSENSVTAVTKDFIPGNFSADDFTKSVISQREDRTLSCEWKENDVIGVIPMNDKSVQSNYEISEIGADARIAVFDGGAWALKAGKEYSAYYPYVKSVARSTDDLNFSFIGQHQESNGSTAHLGDYDYMYAASVIPTQGSVQFEFSHLVSLLCLHIKAPVSADYSAVIFSLPESSEYFASEAALSLSDGKMTAVKPSKTMCLYLNGFEVTAGEDLCVWLAVLPTEDVNGQRLSVTLKAGGNGYLGQDQLTIDTAWEAGKVYSYNCSFSFDKYVPVTVDLGLPSGVKWAECNLGAVSPEDYGDYYAWGEVQTSNYYYWTNYKWSAGNMYSMTKYCITPDYGTVDNKYLLDQEDDAAYVKLGGKWRMPSYADIKELEANCIPELTSIGGVMGVKMTSKINGNSIFLPAGEFYSRDKAPNPNIYDCIGYYWLSSIYVNEQDRSYDYHGRYFAVHVCNYTTPLNADAGGYRYRGQSIRPVSE